MTLLKNINKQRLARKVKLVCSAISLVVMGFSCAASANQYWLTSGDLSAAFEEQGEKYAVAPSPEMPLITIDKSQAFQTMEGFGYTLNGGSATHLANMSDAARARLLQEIFGQSDGANTNKPSIGVSYLRLSLGASDLDPAPFSYNDLPPGEVDLKLEKFTIAQDEKTLIPILKQILAINPNITFMASPWSPPVWMKTNGSTIGGELNPEYYSVYAQYFVKYVQAMAEHGINIDAITIQNEPMHPGNNPSLLMHAKDQADFIANHLGPAFKQAELKTKIIVWDHNADKPEYPIEVLNHPVANQYIHGSAFHLYGGDVNAISQVHNAHPDKHLYFTEQWVGANSNFWGDVAWHVENLIVGATRNWCKTVLEWNLAADSNLQPHTLGGCDACLGALTIDGDNVKRNAAYYIIAHAAKHVPPGSVRIHSHRVAGLPNVAFLTPQKKVVVVVLNNTTQLQSFTLVHDRQKFAYSMPAQSVVTLVID
ncbi:glycoside hydrolase family 30 protein [Saccharophagus degradans]|uniref:Putative retaining b-glycosidase n=1 Tax=Saccharophagus degradans (strain 2-40 / ATCC 43961 / DSM 17024) TaxID=203122 RepID=Q21GC8_SACD2|nr:glycoside hydrolase family 30 beta sandwich domain-containing protein [Saccharophagus degradans]ABD82251.1 putative retaining b-glycosidase [Saccharophagus degradans 2-40]